MINNKDLDQVLHCRKCNNNFRIIINKKDKDVIHEGYLKCENCNDQYRIDQDIIFIDQNIVCAFFELPALFKQKKMKIK